MIPDGTPGNVSRPAAEQSPTARSAGDDVSFLDDLKQYVGFNEQSTAALQGLYPLAAPHFSRIVDDFFATIDAHPRAREALRGGPVQAGWLRHTLADWLATTLSGPHDDAYLVSRARIGRVHVQAELPQAYMFMAMNRIRVHLVEIAQQNLAADLPRLFVVTNALHQILDIELAIMLETYRDDLLLKNRRAERLATIAQVATSIGHELRNPLAVIESSAFLLRQRIGPEDPSQPSLGKHIDRIARETKQATKTIADLLDLASNRPPRRLRTSLNVVVRAALEVAQLPPAVTVETSVPPELYAELDANQIQHIITNLVINASQAMGGAGRIQIEAGMVEGGLCLRVQDEGPGVPKEIWPRLFEPLFTTKAKGTGLGLALCRRIMDAHGGTIRLEPTSTGASFVISIPS